MDAEPTQDEESVASSSSSESDHDEETAEEQQRRLERIKKAKAEEENRKKMMESQQKSMSKKVCLFVAVEYLYTLALRIAIDYEWGLMTYASFIVYNNCRIRRKWNWRI